MKKWLFITLIIILFTSSGMSYAIYETLPADLGSNSNIINIINPSKSEGISYEDTYLISCTADPGTEITLYERYDDTWFVPLLNDDEAITAVVGESGLFLVNLTLELNSTNKIMFYAQKGTKYQTVFKTILVKEKEIKESVTYKTLNIKEFAVPGI